VEDGVRRKKTTTRIGVLAATLALGTMTGVMVAPVAAQSKDAGAALQQQRYQISQMERMLEGAVEHGATLIRSRLQAILPAQMPLINENARARGFRLEGYGVFFDVAVPTLQGSMWIFQTLDQNDLALTNAFKVLKAHVDGAGDEKLKQALERIELQVAPLTAAPDASQTAGTQTPGTSTPVAASAAASAAPAADSVATDWSEEYHNEVRNQVVDAMLQYAGSLAIGPQEWLTVALRTNEDRPMVGPADGQFTMILRVRGDDLAAFRAGRYSKDEAVKHVQVGVF
jgi:hypothetical protein